MNIEEEAVAQCDKKYLRVFPRAATDPVWQPILQIVASNDKKKSVLNTILRITIWGQPDNCKNYLNFAHCVTFN